MEQTVLRRFLTADGVVGKGTEWKKMTAGCGQPHIA